MQHAGIKNGRVMDTAMPSAHKVGEQKLCIAHCHGVYGVKAFLAHTNVPDHEVS